MALSNKVLNVRKQFRQEYGNSTVNIIRDFAEGRSTSTIAKSMKVSTGTVAAVRANLTRGVYSPFAVVTKNREVIGSMFV